MTDHDADAAPREAALALSAERFRALGHALVDRIAATWSELPARPLGGDETPAAVRARLGGAGLPEQGSDAGALLDEAAALLLDHGLLASHPRFHGYVAAAPAPIGVLAELLAAALNANVALWHAAPMASEIETQTLRWLAELVGFPAGGGGLLTSGGNLANLVALLAARRAGLPAVREAGLQGARVAVYASTQTHAWLLKAVDIAGLGQQAIRWIATDDRQRLDVGALAARIAADRADGVQPLLAIGTAGTVSTGAIDPLPAMAALCRAEGLWFHVDGAYGAPAACLPDAPPELLGLREADSLALDPHKWLSAPIEAGCLLVRDARHLPRTFASNPPYYGTPADDEGPNFHELGPQNTRGFRALKVWLGLRMAGRAGYRRILSDDLALAARLRARVAATPRLEGGPGGLSIATLRYRPPAGADAPATPEALDALNRRLLEHLQRDGRAWLSPAVVDGRFWLRACFVNFRTEAAHVDALPALVQSLGDALCGDA